MANTFNLNNAGPGDVVVAAAVRGQRYRVNSFTFSFGSGNGCQFRSGMQPNGPTISGLYQAGDGSSLTPANTGGFKGFRTEPGAPLVLTITGSGTVTGEVVFDLLPPGS